MVSSDISEHILQPDLHKAIPKGLSLCPKGRRIMQLPGPTEGLSASQDMWRNENYRMLYDMLQDMNLQNGIGIYSWSKLQKKKSPC